MNTLEMTVLIWLGSLLAGFLGALTGLGGGVVIVPLLTLMFHFDIRYAIGASLVSVIATSSGAAAAYVKEGYANLRIGVFLEIATTLGALAGASLAVYMAPESVAVTFGVVLAASAYLSGRPRRPAAKKGTGPICRNGPPGASHKLDLSPFSLLASRLRLDGSYPANGGRVEYHVRGVPGGFAVMGVAGVLSGLLGIGSGALKVLAMDQIMRVPFKVSTTTSNFMIGVTAAASAGCTSTAGTWPRGWPCRSCWACCPAHCWGRDCCPARRPGGSASCLRWSSCFSPRR